MKSFQDKYWEHVTKGHKKMFSSKIRAGLYLLTVFVNTTVGFLVASGSELPVMLLAVIAGFNAVVALMAKSNVTPDEE